MANIKKFKAKTFVPGKATGPALVTKERLIFGVGGGDNGIFDAPTTPPELKGVSFDKKVVIHRSGKCGSGVPRALDKCVRAGVAPVAVVNLEIEPLAVVGCALQDIPLVQVEDSSIFDQVKNGDTVTVDADKGEVVIIKKGGD